MVRGQMSPLNGVFHRRSHKSFFDERLGCESIVAKQAGETVTGVSSRRQNGKSRYVKPNLAQEIRLTYISVSKPILYFAAAA